jgi:hypothetical protein
MVEKPYCTAESMDGKYQDLVAQFNQYGMRRADNYESTYGRTDDERSHKEIEVGGWACGPLLYIEDFDSDGETRKPTISDKLCRVVAQAGYVPWGFRAEEEDTSPDGDRDATGRWMWYLRPVEDVRAEDSRIYETAYAIEMSDGTFVRTDDGDLVTFDSEAEAEAVLTRDDYNVAEVLD